MKTLLPLAALTLVLAASPAAAQASLSNSPKADGAYCHIVRSAAADCTFNSLAACEKKREGQGGDCMENPKHRNTGYAAGTKAPTANGR